jgi:hypothetical protein
MVNFDAKQFHILKSKRRGRKREKNDDDDEIKEENIKGMFIM